VRSPAQEAKGSLRRSGRKKRGVNYDAEWTEDADMDGDEAENSEEDDENVFKDVVKQSKKNTRSKKRKKDEADDVVDLEREREIEREIQQERERQNAREREKEKEAQAKAQAEAEKEKEKDKDKDKDKDKETQPEITISALSSYFKPKRGKEPIVSCPVDDLVHSKATLIVCPVALLRQWESELRSKVRPGSLRILQYHGPKRLKDVIKVAKGYDIVLTSYSILTHDRTTQKHTPEGVTSPWGTLERIHWHRIVLDEAHYIKSPSSLTSRVCRILAGTIKWAVTGTPIQNSLSDIVGLFDFLNLEPFRTKYSFSNLDTHQLLDILRNLVMRHTKEQKLGGKPLVALPPRTERVVYSEMTDDERTLYTHLFSICSVKFNALAHQNAISSHYTYVMSSLILPLRQLCAHVSLVNPDRFIDDTGGGAKRHREGPQAQALTEDVDLKPALEKMRKGNRTEITEILSKSGHPECPICLEVSDLPTVTPCLHLFCNGCIREIAQQGRGTCPLCRMQFAEGDLMDVFPSTASSTDPLSAELDPEVAAVLTKLQNTHSSKTAKIMEELKAIIAKDRTSKVVIFTQWTPFFK
jgi:DNA repair protein RAD5